MTGTLVRQRANHAGTATVYRAPEQASDDAVDLARLTAGHIMASPAPSDELAPLAIVNDYEVARSRVEASDRRMRAVIGANHGPAEVRDAATELTDALRDATAIVVRTLRRLHREALPEPRRRRRRKATRAVPADVAAWSAELMRLSQTGAWLRLTTLERPGVHIPATVQVSSRAATGPPIAGMIAGADTVSTSSPGEPLIGVDLRAIVDSYRGAPTSDAPARAGAEPTPAA